MFRRGVDEVRLRCGDNIGGNGLLRYDGTYSAEVSFKRTTAAWHDAVGALSQALCPQ